MDSGRLCSGNTKRCVLEKSRRHPTHSIRSHKLSRSIWPALQYAFAAAKQVAEGYGSYDSIRIEFQFLAEYATRTSTIAPQKFSSLGSVPPLAAFYTKVRCRKTAQTLQSPLPAHCRRSYTMPHQINRAVGCVLTRTLLHRITKRCVKSRTLRVAACPNTAFVSHRRHDHLCGRRDRTCGSGHLDRGAGHRLMSRPQALPISAG